MNNIDQFFKNDGIKINGRIKKSILLALIDDMQFCLGMYGRYKVLNLSSDDHEKLMSILPSFSVLTLYFTGIDVLARVYKRSLPKPNEEGIYFKSILSNYSDLTEDVINELYELRKEIVHKYSIRPKHSLRRFGSSSPAEKLDNDNWVITLNALYSNFIKISNKVYETVTKDSAENKHKTELYLEKNGFIYIRI